MFIISAEEFRQKTAASLNKQEKKYQNKLLNAGPVFSKQNKQLALKYCQCYHQNQQVCLVVEEQYYWQVWYEDQKSASHSKTQSKSQNRTTENMAINKSFTERIIIDRLFINHCQQILVELIGPIATIICKRTATQNPHVEQSKFIELIAKQIPESQKAEEFKKQLLN